MRPLASPRRRWNQERFLYYGIDQPASRLASPETSSQRTPVRSKKKKTAEGGRHIAGDPIRPPRLEDAGLEDCALPQESIAEAFSLAALAVSSRLPHLSLSDDEDEGDDPLAPRGGCVEAGPTCGAIPESLVGGGRGSECHADEVMVVAGRGDEEDRVVVVVGQELGQEKGCAEGTREGEQRKVEDGIVEKAILVKDFA
ncbi:uncharacterized protein LOC119333655 [Triticum dicoccoides]|uniref:uncharacterized protein LOC119333655 n=1 Tax=Triticum dicoccoides TaxID=85692 RepID=UPI001890FDE0|nr:uncharacterized protein LOC119333655 [Triticum dicoccoides]